VRGADAVAGVVVLDDIGVGAVLPRITEAERVAWHQVAASGIDETMIHHGELVTREKFRISAISTTNVETHVETWLAAEKLSQHSPSWTVAFLAQSVARAATGVNRQNGHRRSQVEQSGAFRRTSSGEHGKNNSESLCREHCELNE
jgi:hypothetical protein